MRYIRVTIKQAIPLAASKTATLNLRIDPTVKEGLRIAAAQEHRSIANLIELLVRRHCKESGITIPEQQALSLDVDHESKNAKDPG